MNSNCDYANKEKIINFEGFRRLVSTITFMDDTWFDDDLGKCATDKRTLSIKALIKTESCYLKGIKFLLCDICLTKKIFHNILNRSMIHKLVNLLKYLPTIYELHLTLHKKIKGCPIESLDIGNLLFQFLSQDTLLDVYKIYISVYTDCAEIFSTIKEKQLNKTYSQLSKLESITVTPIQRFPQLSSAISDIYKYTSDGHTDKINLYKAHCITKAITSRLDFHQRGFECTDFSQIPFDLKKKLNFSSKLVLAKYSVFKIIADFHIPRRLEKIPYFLILCDRNVVMIPRERVMSDFTDKIVFSYSLEEVSFMNDVSSCSIKRHNCYTDLEEIKDLYCLLNQSSENDVILSEFEELLNDYKVLLKISEDIMSLKYSYSSMDPKKVFMSLIHIRERLKSKETELNVILGSFLTLTVKTCNSLEDKHVFLFDSLRQSNEWKVKFQRAKLLSNVDGSIGWRHYSFSKQLNAINLNELPLTFSPFVLNDNGIINRPLEIIISKAVALIVGLKVFRCLLMCLNDGWIFILYFDDRQWMFLETFRIDAAQSVSSICISKSSFINCKDHAYDSEIWIASGDTIWIHSLQDNRRSTTENVMKLPSEIKSMCNVEKDVLVAMKSKHIFIYSQSQTNGWEQKMEISFKKVISTYTEEIKDLYYGHGMLYVLFKTQIIIFKKEKNEFPHLNVFESLKEITALALTADGVLVTENNPIQLILYDKLLESTLQIISLPLLIYKTYSVGTITCILTDNFYTWLGTEKGMIICISSMDRFYCTDDKIPMYFSSTSSAGPITQLISFQNIKEVNVNGKSFSRKNDGDKTILRSSSEPSLTKIKAMSQTCQEEIKFIPSMDKNRASMSSTMAAALENLKITTPKLILATGSGIAKYTDNIEGEQFLTNVEFEHKMHSTLFTFLE